MSHWDDIVSEGYFIAKAIEVKRQTNDLLWTIELFLYNFFQFLSLNDA